jgi:hypothetical protein
MLQPFLRRLPNLHPPLRIVTWNCNMKFRAKIAQLTALQPSIAVLQECESPSLWGDTGATNWLWHGDNPNKGLAILSFGEWRLEAVPQLDPTIQLVLPAQVAGPLEFNILGVWTKNSTIRGQSYIGQINKAAQVYRGWLSSEPSVVAGDWNSDAVFRKLPGRASHADVVQMLTAMGLVSTYHAYHRCDYGYEQHVTWYMNKATKVTYHLDYCFVPATWTSRIRKVSVGDFPEWRPYSDHVPIVVEIRM